MRRRLGTAADCHQYCNIGTVQCISCFCYMYIESKKNLYCTCIAGNFQGVQIFAFFEDAHFSAKLKSRPSCYLEDNCTGFNYTHLCSACKQQQLEVFASFSQNLAPSKISRYTATPIGSTRHVNQKPHCTNSSTFRGDMVLDSAFIEGLQELQLYILLL